jgi:integrase
MKNPNGYGSVYKLSGNRRRPWVARITDRWEDGRQIYITIGYFKSRKEANIALAEYHNNPYDVASRKLTFAEVYERWAERRFPQVSPNRAAQFTAIYNAISEFHEKPFADIKLMQLQAYFDRRTDISSASLQHYKILFNQLYKFALKHEITDKNYAQFIEIRRTGKVKPHKTFSEEELAALWAAKDDRAVQVVLILIYTGLRITELLEMQKFRVNVQERYMVGGIKTEAGRDRIIPISLKILPVIEALMQEESRYLLAKQNKGASEKYSYHGFRYAIWKPLLKRFGFDHAIHDTRHTFISLMDAAGANKTALKRIVGHKNEDVTEDYTHKTLGELIREIDKI